MKKMSAKRVADSDANSGASREKATSPLAVARAAQDRDVLDANRQCGSGGKAKREREQKPAHHVEAEVWSATAWWSAFKARATPCAMRRSPSSRSRRCSSRLGQSERRMHGASLRNRNVASVIVTTDLEAGTEPGSRLDVTVSALGDAPSLVGGTLLLTQLQGADGTVYASAQGAVSVSGFETQGQGETLSQGVPTAGRIPHGAIVEHEVPAFPDELRSMLELKNPDYATAVRIVDAINAYSRDRFRAHAAYEVDSRTVELFRPRNVSFARFMAEVGELQVEPDMAARVVLDARTGTVVVGQDVQISTVAVTYGTLTVRVNEQPRVSQPNPFANGRTVVAPNTKIDVEQGGGPIAIVGGSSLRALVSGLNRIGVKPPGIIAILQAIKTAGALQADLVIQ
jgi:flagellar P-ring protein precursor FlgI